MKHISTIILTTLYLLLSTGAAQSQTWQWGERGGSSDGTLGGGADEYAKEIATDANGNVYLLAHSVGKTSLSIGGTPVTKNWGAFDIMLASFTCSGQLRWYKIIGCKGEDRADALAIDNAGGVYISFHSSLAGSNSNNLHFDTDTTVFIANTSNGQACKSIFLAKFDTSGNFQWVAAPQPDTVGQTAFSNSIIISLGVDAQSNLHCLSILPPGLYGGTGGYSISQQGTYILKYNTNGIFQGGVHPDIDLMQSAGRYAYFTRDNHINRYYISGKVDVFGPVYIGGQKLQGIKYIAAFNNNGGLIWKRDDTATNGGGIGGPPAIDDSGNIYIAGTTVKGNKFNGYVTITDITAHHGTVMVMKMDKDGKMIWAENATTDAATFSSGIALRNSGEVVLTGHYPGLLKFNTYGYTDSLNLPPNTGYRPFLAKFNTQTGKILGLDYLSGTDYVRPYNTISDGRNNIYICGEFGSSLTVNGKKLNTAGGTKDFFVAKYGHNNCNCTNIPEPKFTLTKTSHFDYRFTYTGTPGTMEWDLGDGATSTQSTFSHTYATPNLFIACVKVTNACGDNIYCAKIDTRWPEDVSTIGEGNRIKIYPNPANDVLTIEGQQAGTQIELYDIVGRNVYRGVSKTEKETINVSHLPQGNYIIQLTGTNGQRMTRKVVKR